MILKNCVQNKEGGEVTVYRQIENGAFGIKKRITVAKEQKVYVRIKVSSEKLAKVRLGVLDKGTWYTEEKIGRGQKILSVVKSCKEGTVDVIVTAELTDEIVVSEFVVETIGDAKFEKRILNKIKYCNKELENVWKGEKFRLTSDNEKIVRKKINCSLEKGTLYWIKVLAKEVTNCGRMWLECGHNQSPQRGQLVTAFRYVGRMPEFAIKGNKFSYIVKVDAVVVAKANTIGFEDFWKKEYWR